MPELKVGVAIEARDAFSSEARKIAAASDKLADRLKAGQRQLAELGRREGALKRLDAMGAKLSKTASSMDLAAGRTAALRKQIQAAEAPSKRLAREFEDAQRASTRLRREHVRQRDELRGLRRELREAGVDTDDLARSQRRAADSLQEASWKIDRVNEAARSYAALDADWARRREGMAHAAMIFGEARQASTRLRQIGFAPIARARPLGESQGLLRQLGLDQAAVDDITQRGRAVTREIPGISTAGFTDLAYPIKSGISSLSPQGVADLSEIAVIAARASASQPMEIADTLARSFATFKAPLAPEMGDREFAAMFAAGLTASAQQFRTTGTEMAAGIENMGSGLSLLKVPLAEQLAVLGRAQGALGGDRVGTGMEALYSRLAESQNAFAKQFEAQGRDVSIRLLDDRDVALPLAGMLENMRAAFGSEWTARTGADIAKAFGSVEAVRLLQNLWSDPAGLGADVAVVDRAMAAGEDFIRAVQQARDSSPHAELQVAEQRLAAIMEEVGERQLEALQVPLEMSRRILDRVDRMFGRDTAANVMLGAGAVGAVAEVAADVGMAAFGGRMIAPWLRRWRAKGELGRSLKDLPQAPRPKLSERASERIRQMRGDGWRGTLGKGLGAGKSIFGRAASMLKGKGGLFGAGLAAVSLGSTLRSDRSAGEKAVAAGENLGAIGGGFGGAALGAAIGTAILPGIGTAIGGLFGSFVGSYAGHRAGGAVGSGVAGLLPPGEAPAGPSPEPLPVQAARHDGEARVVVHNHNDAPIAQIIIQQREGEDNRELLSHMLEALEEYQDERQRSQYADAY